MMVVASRKHVVGFILGLCLLCVQFTAHAEEDSKQAIPLKRVVMVNSGIGFFEHSGKVDGDKTIEFSVNVDDINDLLKSLVVQDLGGGRVTSANYGSPDPVSKTLQTLAVDISRNPSLAMIFHQLRGQKVELTMAAANNPIVGTVAGVERRRIPVGRDQQILDQDLILLRTESGLRSIVVESIMLTRFVDPKTDREFQQALDLLAESRRRDSKTIKLDFRGKGQRAVSVGYVQESPVWKTTYRLVLEDDKPPFLQGWAIVENTTAQDWNNVSLTLMSGRPVSFQMDLYQPLFAARPEVALDLHTSVEPRLYNQDLTAREDEFLAAATKGSRGSGNPSNGRNFPVGMGGGFGGGGGGIAAGFMGGGGPGAVLEPEAKPLLNLAQGVEAAATTDDVGESFRYAIKSPVSLKRNESALLPIVNEAIQGEKIYIFNSSVHAKHPLAGVRLKNSSEVHLQQGPITVFDGGEYAGDARITDVPPGSKRLISYAMDLETEIVERASSQPAELIAIRIQSGEIQSKSREKRRVEYTIKNAGSHSKALLIERPVDVDWAIVEPKPEEQTRDIRRHAVTADPGKPALVTITESRDTDVSKQIQTLTDQEIQKLAASKATSAPLNAAFKKLLERRSVLAVKKAAREKIEKQIQLEVGDQARIRENLKATGLDDSLKQRFLKKFAAAEDSLEKLTSTREAAQLAEHQAQMELDDFVRDLNVE